MRLLAKGALLLLAAVAVGATTMSFAGPDDADTPDRPVSRVSGSTMARLSIGDMAIRSAGIEAQIKDDYRHVLHQQSVARRAKDVIKLNCINDKLVQLKAQMYIFDGIHSSLTGALAGNNDERFALYGEVTLAGENIKRLRQEADVCAGEPELYKQENRPEWRGPQIPDDPTAGNPFNQGVEPPGYASPFR
jgi:hypothetical protein